MSVGHKKVPADECGKLPAKLRELITPQIIKIISNRVARVQVMRKDVPLIAGASEDGQRVYIDRRVADSYLGKAISDHEEKEWKPDDTVPWHELSELYFEEEEDMDYTQSHLIGDWFERWYVEGSLGITWDSYQGIFEDLIPICRRHIPQDTPSDIRMEPYRQDGDPEMLRQVLRAQGHGADETQEASSAPKDGLQAPAKHAVVKTATQRTGTCIWSFEKSDGKEQEGMSDFKLYVPIDLEKVDKKQHMVWGYASTPSLDLDNEIVKLDAIEEALPDYMEWRNIREMHQPSAVGTTKEAHVDGDGLYIGAKIVDKDAWEKVLEGVYRGFSIGGRTLEKNENEITKLRLTEISLVDRPANPDCRIEVIKVAKTPDTLRVSPVSEQEPITLERAELGLLGSLLQKLGIGKREFSQKERDSAADSGAALPDGSFPIHNKQDLHNAIQAHGRAKDKAKAKAHIVSRAHALGAADMLPDGWSSKESAATSDLALANKVGHIEEDPAEAMGDEFFFTSFDDLGEIEMTASPEELRKRVAAAHKAAVHKAMACLGKAEQHHMAGMNSLEKCYKMWGKAAKPHDGEHDGDGEEEMDGKTFMSHMRKAASHFNNASDMRDVAAAHLGKVASSWGSDWGGKDAELPTSTGGSIHEPGQSSLTEGHVPVIDADEVYPGKAAKVDTISKAEHEALLAAAIAKATAENLQKQVDALMKAPAGSPRARAFAIGKQSFPVGDDQQDTSGDKMSKLMQGVDAFDLEDPEQRQKAAARMFGNQIINPGVFGKNIYDGGFKGGATRGK